MIFIGTKTKELARVDLSLHCPNCNQRGDLQLFILSKSFTMFTFSAFPIENTGIVGCNACEATFVKREMTPEMLEETGILIRQHTAPWYNFIPGMLIVIITTISMCMLVVNNYR